MHKIYEDEGIFNLMYLLPQIIYSSLISTVINYLVNYLSLSEEKIIEIKHENNIDLLNEKAINTKKFLKFNSFYFLLFALFF